MFGSLYYFACLLEQADRFFAASATWSQAASGAVQQKDWDFCEVFLDFLFGFGIFLQDLVLDFFFWDLDFFFRIFFVFFLFCFPIFFDLVRLENDGRKTPSELHCDLTPLA